MLTIQTTFPWSQTAPWGRFISTLRQLEHRWAMARLHRATLKEVSALSDDQLRDLGLHRIPDGRTIAYTPSGHLALLGFSLTSSF